MKVIDFHTHIFADGLAPRAMSSMLEGGGDFYHPVHDLTMAGHIACMDRCGVTQSVILPVMTKRKQTEKVCDWAASCKSDRIIPFGGIFPNSDDWKEQIDYVASLGLPGIKLHAEFQGFSLDDPVMLKLHDYAFSKGLLVIHHAGYDPAYQPPWHTSPKMFAHILDELGGGKLIAAHLGGFTQWDETLEYLAGRDIYVDTSMGFEYFSDPDMFMKIARAIGTDHMLFGTDSPWGNPATEIAHIMEQPLTEEEKENIFHRNTERLLHLA